MNLMRACAKGDLATVKKLVTEGADVKAADASGRTPLLEAAWGGNVDVVKVLVEKGADVNTADNTGFTPLMRAAEEGHQAVVSLLIQKGAHVNARGKVRGTTPLMLAAEKGFVKILEILLKSKANVNDVDQYEETAMARAFRTEQMKAAEFLESKGGRGKPERSSISHNDRESRNIAKDALPKWSAAAAEGGYDEDSSSGEGPEEE